MKGSIGVPMNAIEHRKQKRYGEYNHKCSDCKFLEYIGGRGCPYKCGKNSKARYYTSKVWCKRFEEKGEK